MSQQFEEPGGALQKTTPASLLQVIASAVANPAVDIEKMRALFELQKDILAEQHRIEFAGALTRLQAKCPQIGKHGKGKNSKYAKLEDIDDTIRRPMTEEGFNLTFDEESHTDRDTTFVMTLAHEAGHSETKRLTVPIDESAKNSQGQSIRPRIQDMGSTVSYARRYLLKMHLNIIETDEDTDGEPRRRITVDQARDLEAAVDEINMDKGKFLVYMAVGGFDEILESDFRKALNAIDTRRRNPK